MNNTESDKPIDISNTLNREAFLDHAFAEADGCVSAGARDPAPRQIYTPRSDEDATAVFIDRAAAQAAADAAMPRRTKHDRPYVQPSGYDWRRLGRDAWTVCASPNWVMLCDGTMHDFARSPIPAPARDRFGLITEKTPTTERPLVEKEKASPEGSK